MPEVLLVPRGWALVLLVAQLARRGAASREPTSGPRASRAARPWRMEPGVASDTPNVLGLVQGLRLEEEGLLGESPPKGIREMDQEAKADFRHLDSAIRRGDLSVVSEIAKEVKRDVRMTLNKEMSEESNDLLEAGEQWNSAAAKKMVGESKALVEVGNQKRRASHGEMAKESKAQSEGGAAEHEKGARRIRVTPQGGIIGAVDKDLGARRRSLHIADLGHTDKLRNYTQKDRAPYLKAVKDALREGNLTQARALANELIDLEKALQVRLMEEHRKFVEGLEDLLKSGSAGGKKHEVAGTEEKDPPPLQEGDLGEDESLADDISQKVVKEHLEDLQEAISAGDLNEARELADRANDVLQFDASQAVAKDIAEIQVALAVKDLQKAGVLVNAILEELQPKATSESVSSPHDAPVDRETEAVHEELENLRIAEKNMDTETALDLADGIKASPGNKMSEEDTVQATEEMQRKAEQALHKLSGADPDVRQAELAASKGLKECALKRASPEDVLQQLRDCTSSLFKFAKVTEKVKSLSRSSNEAYRQSLDKVSVLLAKMGDAPSIEAALERDQAKARRYFLNEADKLYASIDSMRQSDLEQ